MKIVILTSTVRSPFSNFNIGTLINKTDDDLYFIIVKKKVKKRTLSEKLKKILVSIIRGRDHLKIDQQKISKDIERITPSFNIEDFPHYYINNLNGQECEDVLNKIDPDVIIQSGAGILKENIFSKAKKGTLNVHHGRAPEIRGVQSTFWCLYYGLTDLIGVSCHLIDKNLDTGPIITQYNYVYTKGDTFIEIQKELCKRGAELLLDALKILKGAENLNFQETNVLSYYFSYVDYIEYNKLKRRNFQPLKDTEHLKTKILAKRIYSPT